MIYNLEHLLKELYGIDKNSNAAHIENTIIDNKKNSTQVEKKPLQVRLNFNPRTDTNNLYILLDLLHNMEAIKEKYKEIQLYMYSERIPTKYFNEIYKFYRQCDLPIKVAVEHTLGNSFILEETKFWDIDTIINANMSIDKVCDYIKKCNLSQCEALAFIHQYVSTLTEYKISNAKYKSWTDNDQFYVSAFSKKREVVCAGFSALEKEIIDTLNMPGLECDIIAVDFYDYDKDEKASHARNFIKIKDAKYGVNQSCFDDTTWDNTTEKTPRISHFMMPNDCHSYEKNQRYEYWSMDLVLFSSEKTEKWYEGFPKSAMFQKSKELEQTDIEKIYFSMLQKTNPKNSFKAITTKLAEIVKTSFKEQQIRKSSCTITSETLATPMQTLEKLYEFNLDEEESKYSF